MGNRRILLRLQGVGLMHDKMTEIVVRYIENLERIEAELTDDVADFAERAQEAERTVRYLQTGLESMAAGGIAEAERLLSGLTCFGDAEARRDA